MSTFKDIRLNTVKSGSITLAEIRTLCPSMFKEDGGYNYQMNQREASSYKDDEAAKAFVKELQQDCFAAGNIILRGSDTLGYIISEGNRRTEALNRFGKDDSRIGVSFQIVEKWDTSLELAVRQFVYQSTAQTFTRYEKARVIREMMKDTAYQLKNGKPNMAAIGRVLFPHIRSNESQEPIAILKEVEALEAASDRAVIDGDATAAEVATFAESIAKGAATTKATEIITKLLPAVANLENRADIMAAVSELATTTEKPATTILKEVGRKFKVTLVPEEATTENGENTEKPATVKNLTIQAGREGLIKALHTAFFSNTPEAVGIWGTIAPADPARVPAWRSGSFKSTAAAIFVLRGLPASEFSDFLRPFLKPDGVTVDLEKFEQVAAKAKPAKTEKVLTEEEAAKAAEKEAKKAEAAAAKAQKAAEAQQIVIINAVYMAFFDKKANFADGEAAKNWFVTNFGALPQSGQKTKDFLAKEGVMPYEKPKKPASATVTTTETAATDAATVTTTTENETV